MRRLLASVLLAVVLAIGFVAPVAASGPTRDVYAIGAGTLPAGEACAFPLAFEPIVANAYTLTFPEQPDGTVREQFSGRIVVRFTNTNTGKSVVYNISGPARVVYYPDGSFTLINYGPTFSWQTPAEGGPTAFIQHGRMVTQVDSPDFLFIVTERHGKTTDLCAVLTQADQTRVSRGPPQRAPATSSRLDPAATAGRTAQGPEVDLLGRLPSRLDQVKDQSWMRREAWRFDHR